MLLEIRDVKPKICKKCVLCENKPFIWLNEEKVCNICSEFDKTMQKKQLLESEFFKLLNKHRGKGKYDCMVMCSGGKDSVMSLYLIKKKYKMNPLVFTFDHGFEDETAIKNIKNAVSALNVDWLYYRTDYIQEAFQLIIKTNSKAPICNVCALWYIQLAYKTAKQYKIPMIVAGWRKAQSNTGINSEYTQMSEATSKFIKNELRKISKYKNFPENTKQAISVGKGIRMVSPHWFIDWKESYKEILKNNLNWEPTKDSYPANSTNCRMNFVSTYLSMKNYGFTHYHIEKSKDIREGRISRKEAINQLKINFSRNKVKKIIKELECKINSKIS